jgi:hypothetical protein
MLHCSLWIAAHFYKTTTREKICKTGWLHGDARVGSLAAIITLSTELTSADPG